MIGPTSLIRSLKQLMLGQKEYGALTYKSQLGKYS